MRFDIASIEQVTLSMIDAIEREEKDNGAVLHPIRGEITAADYVRLKTIDYGEGSLYEEILEALEATDAPDDAYDAISDGLYETIDDILVDAGYTLG